MSSKYATTFLQNHPSLLRAHVLVLGTSPMTLLHRLPLSRCRLPLRRLFSASAQPSLSQGPTQPPLLNQTLGKAFRQVVSRAPSAAAVSSVHQRLHWTYQQLSDAVDSAARALIAAGVKRGDRVGILSPNKSVDQTKQYEYGLPSRELKLDSSVEWLVVQLSTAAVGAILVNINPA